MGVVWLIGKWKIFKPYNHAENDRVGRKNCLPQERKRTTNEKVDEEEEDKREVYMRSF